MSTAGATPGATGGAGGGKKESAGGGHKGNTFDANAVRLNLAAALEASGLSLRAAAAAAGHSHGSLSLFLSGKSENLALPTLAALAPVLGTTVGALLGETTISGEPQSIDQPGTVMLALNQIDASDENPRRTFDQDLLDQLAASIAADGILQNLVVRPPVTRGEKAGDYQFVLIAGERRWRALHRLASAGKWDADTANIPCRIVDADQTRARVLAIVENLQRQDVPPLEEADAFAALRALDPDTWTVKAIAERVSRTERYVQQRLAIAGNLSADTRVALAEGRIDVTRARILATVDEERQAELLEKIYDGDWRVRDEAGLRAAATNAMVPVEQAFFDLQGFDGEIFTDDQGAQYVADRDAFAAAQTAAAKAEAQRLERQFAWVEFHEGHVAWSHYRNAVPGDDAPEDVGAVVAIDWQFDVEIRTNQVRIAQETRQHAGPDPAQAEERERHLQKVKAYNTAISETLAALRARMATDPAMARRSLILALVASLDRDHTTSGIICEQRDGTAAVPGLRAALGDFFDEDDGPETGPQWLRDDADMARVWARLAAVDDAAIDALVTALIADSLWQHTAFHWHSSLPGLQPAFRALARHYNIPVPEILQDPQTDIEDAEAVGGETDTSKQENAA